MLFLLTYTDVRTAKFFLPAESWLINLNFRHTTCIHQPLNTRFWPSRLPIIWLVIIVRKNRRRKKSWQGKQKTNAPPFLSARSASATVQCCIPMVFIALKLLKDKMDMPKERSATTIKKSLEHSYLTQKQSFTRTVIFSQGCLLFKPLFTFMYTKLPGKSLVQ